MGKNVWPCNNLYVIFIYFAGYTNNLINTYYKNGFIKGFSLAPIPKPFINSSINAINHVHLKSRWINILFWKKLSPTVQGNIFICDVSPHFLANK